MNDENSRNPLWTGIGLILGTGLGTVISIILDIPIYYAGVGTSIGLIIGSIIDSRKP